MSEKAHWDAYGEKLTRQKQLIQQYVELWIPLMNLERWNIICDYCPAPPDVDMHDAGADCKVHWEYKRAQIRFVMPSLSECSEQEIENTVVHELCHVLVHEMRDVWVNVGRDATFHIKHEERVVCEIAAALIRARCHENSKEEEQP